MEEKMTSFLPESMPAAGITSVGDDRHQYPYSRDDNEVFLAPGDTPERADRRQFDNIRQRIHGSEDMRMLLGKLMCAHST